ncbi:MAG: ABC transporter permease [Bacteroidetes bacterium]|nr:ABC transporter permease [Bacteroidota bacterium]
MRSIQLGAWSNMVDNVVRFYTGYVQVHGDGYWDERTLNKSFEESDSLLNLIAQIPNTQGVVPRLESFALASNGDQTKGVLVVGISPERENFLTNVKDKIIDGEYLEEKDKQVLVSSGLAEYLKLKVNDTLVIISQGYHGVNAAGKYPVKGIMKFGSPELNAGTIFLPLLEAQWFYGAEERLTSIALILDDPDDVSEVVEQLKLKLGDGFEVMDWKQMVPELVQAMEFDLAGGILMLTMLYSIISFGIFGTILMMTAERKYEFGVMVAVGMRKTKLMFVMWLEIIILGLLGVLAGFLVSFPLIYYFHVNPIVMTGQMAEAYESFGVEPILAASVEIGLFFSQIVVVFLVTTLISIYPLWVIGRLKIVQAMRD